MEEEIRSFFRSVWVHTGDFFMKVMVPAIVAISVSIAIRIQRETVKVTSVILSFFIGIGCAYLFGDLILASFSKEWSPVVIGVVSITGNDAGRWLIYKFEFDVIGDAFVRWIISKFKKK